MVLKQPRPTPKGEAVKDTHFRFKKAEKLKLRRDRKTFENVTFVRKVSEIHCIVVNQNDMLECVMILNLERSEQDEYEPRKSHRTYSNRYAQSDMCFG